MKEVKLLTNKFEAYAVTVDVKGGIDEYAKSFLHIFNNVREFKKLIKVENYYGSNDVTVYCELDVLENCIDYLKNFGEIKGYEKVLAYQLIDTDDYDFDKYSDAIVVPYFE